MYSIPKLCIQKNLPNTTNCENKWFFYIYSNLGFEYRIKKIKSRYTTLKNQTDPKTLGVPNFYNEKI